MPTTYELYNYSVAKYGVYNATTIALRKELESEIISANGDAQSLAALLSYDVQIPEKLDDDRTGEELVEMALAPDKTSTGAERVELFETFAEETLPVQRVERATERYEEDISGTGGDVLSPTVKNLLRLSVDETKEERNERRRLETMLLSGMPGVAGALRASEQFRKEGIFAPPPEGELEKEREGMLEKVLAPLLAGERAAGTIIYALRKKLGLGGIEWIERKEAGEMFKEISPSQALGISTPETKLLSQRGAVSLAIDILLDPTTYIGVGVIGKFGKGLKALKIGKRAEEAEKVVGPLGIEYIKETVARGISRETAERKLVQAIERGQVEYLAAKKYAEPSVHIFGQKLFYTRPYQRLVKQIWDIMPYAEKRAAGVDVLKTAFVPFHKIIRDVGAEAKKPFQQFYRRTAGETAMFGKRIERLFGTTPKTVNEEIVLALEKGIEPASPQAKEAAIEIRKIYDEAFEEQVALGMVKPEQYRELYMHHALTKEGREWMKKELGSEYEHGLDIAEYRKRLGSAEARQLEGGVYDVNKMMRKKGIKEFFIEDPYLALQTFGVQHVKATRSHILHRQVMAEYGRPIEDVAKREGVQPKVVQIDGIEHTIFKFKGEETYLPTAMVDELKRTRPATGFWTEVYDPALGSLKKTWISIWPGFYARNVYGGVGWQNILAGVEPTDYARNIDVLYGDPTKIYDVPLYGKMSGKEIRELMEEYNVYGQTGFVGEPSSYITGTGMLGRAYKKYPEQAMHLTENQLRGAVFLHYFYKTGDPEFASEMVYKYHFEYLRGAYTPFEEDVLLRTVPFGKWLIGNIPLQTEMVIRQPGKYAALAKAREMATTPEEYNLLTDWQKQKIMYTHKGTAISVDLPIFELPGLYGREEAYFGLTPFLKWGMRMLEGRDEYGRKMEPLTTPEGIVEHAEMTAMTFAGRYVYAQREIEKTYKGERPLEYTIAHQLAGVGIYELKEDFEQVEQAYEEAKYTKPTPTKREKAIAWAAQGRVPGAQVFALPLPEEEDERRWRVMGTMPIEVNEQTVNRVIEKLEDTGVHGLYRLRGFGTLVSLTAEEREMTKEFKPTDEQLALLEEISELGVTTEGATSRDLYLEMFREHYEQYEARLYRREAFTEEERMAAVARRSPELTDLRFKEIRYETGEKAGILALTPEEYEEYSGFELSEAQKAWMFREGKPLPEEGYERYQEDLDEMYAALITERYERLRYTPYTELEEMGELPPVKMAPSDQLRVWKQEHEAERLQAEEYRKELIELREDPIGKTRSQKGIPAALMLTRGAQDIQTRINRSEELENLLGVGVDR